MINLTQIFKKFRFPSEADLQLTERLIEAGELLGINVLDHVIIGDGKWWSWKENKL